MMGALWRTHFRRTGGRDAALALRTTLRVVRDVAREHVSEVMVNVILASASEPLAIHYAEPGQPNTLYHLEDEARWGGGSVLASEPLDDSPGWRSVDPDTLVRVDIRGVSLEPLDLDRAEISSHLHQEA